ncbi:MAG: hypothetical protein CTY33_05405 [Methylotenera sp.]|nr:MAG: hypothetical protein CTY33_05405 [Methylotenera sp.]
MTYLIYTIAFLLLAVFHNPKWIFAMVFTAFIYKARKPRHEVINPITEDGLHKSIRPDPDFLLQKFHDDLNRLKQERDNDERDLAPGDPK